MMYSKLITEISSTDFDRVYTPSVPYLVNGNLGKTLLSQEASNLKMIMQQRLKDLFNDGAVFELREVGTDVLLSLMAGRIDSDGTFHHVLSFFGPNASGSVSWAFYPPPDAEVEDLMSDTGIKRMVMYPEGTNMESFIQAMGAVKLTDKEDGTKRYRTTWGWSDFSSPDYVTY
jgi:hypothetical protein